MKITPSKDDLLNREKIIYNLSASFIVNRADYLVLAINAPWGEGKSYFVNMWTKFLKKNYGEGNNFNKQDFWKTALPVVKKYVDIVSVTDGAIKELKDLWDKVPDELKQYFNGKNANRVEDIFDATETITGSKRVFGKLHDALAQIATALPQQKENINAIQAEFERGMQAPDQAQGFTGGEVNNKNKGKDNEK